MHFLFLNQYFPPDPAPTGALLGELAEELERTGHRVTRVSAAQDYRPAQGKGGRWGRELAALWWILWRGLRAPRAQVVLSASSPPCLLVVATIVALRHGAKSVHWAMDLYPEIAVALGELKSRPLAALIGALMGWCYRRAAAVVALDADMAERLARYGVKAEVIRPWVSAPVIQWVEHAATPALPQPGRPWVWIYSGNLGRAHEWDTLLQTQRLLEAEDPWMTLVFQGGGPSRAAAQARAREIGLQRCYWRDYAEPEAVVETLLACQAGAVTQLPPARGLLWPSKLGLLLSLPRPFLWIGDAEGAIARELRAIPHAAAFPPGAAPEAAAWLLALKNRGAPPPAPAVDPSTERSGALARWRELLRA